MINKFSPFIFFCLFLSFAIIISCKTKDAPNEIIPLNNVEKDIQKPRTNLFLERISAEDVEHISIFFMLDVENFRTERVTVDIQNWNIEINGKELYEGSNLALDINHNRVAGSEKSQIPLRLDLNMDKFPISKGEIFSEYKADIEINLNFAFDNGDVTETLIATSAIFPRIQEPEFTITSIAVSRGERLNTNTRFRLTLQIDNPNVFPLELTSLSYAFYGNDDFWANGKDEMFIPIPAYGSAETQVYFLIDFIDISKNIQEKLVTLGNVRYRLTGESTVLTNIVYLPRFRMDFDLSGATSVF